MNLKTAAAIFCAVLLLPSPAPAGEKILVDKIAILVNESMVTLSEFNEKKQMVKRRGQQIPDTEIVNSIISEILIEQAAARSSVSISKAEIENSADAFKKSLGLDEAGFAKMLAEQKTSRDEFRDEMRLQILTRKLVRIEVVRRGLAIDDEKIEQAYMLKNPGADRSPQVRIAHILMPGGSEENLLAANAVAEKARSGERDFAELAKTHSVDKRTAGKGGDLGYFKYDELIKPLLQAVEGAKVGDINGPVESSSGLHTVKVIAIKEEGIIVPPEFKNRLIEEIAVRETEKIISSIIEEGFEDSHIEVRM